MSGRGSASLSVRRPASMLGAILLTLLPGAQSLDAQSVAFPDFSARVWLDRGHEPVLERGDRLRVYYRTTRDAYVSVFHIDTNGQVRLVFPASPHQDHWVRGGRDYRVDFASGSRWTVRDDPGVGYFFAIASSNPFDFSAFSYQTGFASSGLFGWDLGASRRAVYHDPYVAMDDFVVALVPGWEYAPYALDFSTYSVGRSYDYPRFLCYECHGYRTFSSWNPYLAACTSFRVVIYNDPWYYPAYRYRGTRVVYTRPPVFRQPRYAFKERARGEAAVPIVRARPTVPSQPPRTVPRNPAVERRAQPVAPPTRAATPTREATPRMNPPTRATTPGTTRGVPPTTAPTRGTTTTVAPPARTRPTQVLPGRAGQGGASGGAIQPGRAVPPRPTTGSTGVGRSNPPLPSRQPTRTGPVTRSTSPSTRTTPPRTPVQARPPVARPGTQVRPPVSRPPVQAQPPVSRPPTQPRPPVSRPPTQARPPVARPPVRTGPPRTGPPRTGGGGPFQQP